MHETADHKGILDFVLEQPAALESTLRHVAEAAGGLPVPDAPHQEVVLIGSGTSKNALIATAPTFRHTHGLPVTVRGPSEFLHDVAAHAPGALAVVLSQTGSSTTTVAALQAARARGLRTIAVTAEAASPFGRAADARIVLPIGPEQIGPKTKGYTASLVALLAVAEVTAPTAPAASCLPGDPAAYGVWFAACLPDWQTLGRGWADRHASSDHVMCIGDEAHLGTVLEASLKLHEMAGVAASAFDLEEALHGRLHGLGPKSLALFVCGAADSERVALAATDVLRELGVPALVVTSAPRDGPGNQGASEAHVRLGSGPGGAHVAALAPVSTIVPFQYFAERTARRRGLDPDSMRYPGLSARLGIKLPSP
jgi:glucoselysine-6-phosphate deglycase